MESKVEFENDRVRVLRVKHFARESHPQTSKQDRLIIYLNEGRIRRTEGGQQQEIHHQAAMWCGKSDRNTVSRT